MLTNFSTESGLLLIIAVELAAVLVWLLASTLRRG